MNRSIAFICAVVGIHSVASAQPGNVGFSQSLFTISETAPAVFTDANNKRFLSPNMTVTRTGGSTGALTVSYCVWVDETANNALEYGPSATGNYRYLDNTRRWVSAGTLNWADGDSSPKTLPFSFTIFGQTQYSLCAASAVQGTVTYSARLVNPTGGGTLGANATAKLEVTDAEAPSAGVINLTARRFYGTDGDSAVVSVRRDGGTSGSVSVDYATSSNLPSIGVNQQTINPGIIGTSYTPVNGTLTWADGDSSVKNFNVSLPTTGNANGALNVAINLSAPTNSAVIGTVPSALLTIQNQASTVYNINDDLDGSTYRVSLPPGPAPVRGILYWWPGTAGDDRHFTTDPAFRKIADLWRFAIVSPRGNYTPLPNRVVFPQPQLGFLFDRLSQIAKTTGRTEILNAPFVFSGMSAGSYSSSSSLGIWPERTIAIIAQEGWTAPPRTIFDLPDPDYALSSSSQEIPAINLGGQLENTQSPPSSIFPAMNQHRQLGLSRSAVAMCWGRGHTFSNTLASYNSIALYWLDQVMAAGRYSASQVPTMTKAPVLGSLPISSGWWGARNCTNTKGASNFYELPGGSSRFLGIAPDASFTGIKDVNNPLVDSWLPTESAARAYRAFASRPSISFSAPSQFTSGLVGQAINLTISENGFGTGLTKVEFYDDDAKIGEDTNSPFTLSWTPTVAGARGLTAVASNASGPSYSAFTLFLANDSVAPTITAGQTAGGVVNLPFAHSLAATGPPSSYLLASGSLPPGVTLNSTTGLLSGTPTAVGIYMPSFTATNSIGTSAAVVVTLTINAASTAVAYEGFEQANGSQLAGAAGGSGWTTTWTAQADRYRVTNPGGLTYPALATSGGSVEKFDQPTFSNGMSRSFAPQSGRVWASALLRFQQIPSYFEFKLNGATNINWSAKFGINGGNLFTEHSGSGSSAGTPFAPALNQTYLCVFTYSSAGEAPTAIYVNPDIGGSAPVNSLASAVFPGTNWSMPGGVGQLSMYAANGLLKIDEIRIGSTFAEVTPTAAVLTGLQNFRAAQGLAADGSQDLLTPASDGVENLLKYAFNMLGSGAGQGISLATTNTGTLGLSGFAGLPLGGAESGTGKLQLTYIRRKSSTLPGIMYAVEFSDAFAPWSVNGSATESSISVDDTFERVTVTDSAVSSPSRFVRAKVTAP